MREHIHKQHIHIQPSIQHIVPLRPYSQPDIHSALSVVMAMFLLLEGRQKPSRWVEQPRVGGVDAAREAIFLSLRAVFILETKFNVHLILAAGEHAHSSHWGIEACNPITAPLNPVHSDSHSGFICPRTSSVYLFLFASNTYASSARTFFGENKESNLISSKTSSSEYR